MAKIRLILIFVVVIRTFLCNAKYQKNLNSNTDKIRIKRDADISKHVFENISNKCTIPINSSNLSQVVISGYTFIHVFLSFPADDQDNILVNESKSDVINPAHWVWIVGTEGHHLARLPFDFTFLSLGTLKPGVDKVTIKVDVSHSSCFMQSSDEERLEIIAISILQSTNTTDDSTNSMCIEKVKSRESLQIPWYYIHFVSSYLIYQISTYYECWDGSETAFDVDREEVSVQLTVVFVISFILSLFFPLFIGFFHRINPIVYSVKVSSSYREIITPKEMSKVELSSPKIVVDQLTSQNDVSVKTNKFLSLETDLSLGIKHFFLFFGNCYKGIFIARWIIYILLFIALPYIPIAFIQSIEELDFSKRREKTFSNDILNANFNTFSHVFFNLSIFLLFTIVLYFKSMYSSKFTLALNEKESERKKALWWRDLPDELRIPYDEYQGTQKFLFLLMSRMKMGANFRIWTYGIDIYKDFINDHFDGMMKTIMFIVLALPFFIVFLLSIFLLSIPTLYCFTRVVLFSLSFRSVLSDIDDPSGNFSQDVRRRLSTTIEKYFQDTTETDDTNKQMLSSESVEENVPCDTCSINESKKSVSTMVCLTEGSIDKNVQSTEVRSLNAVKDVSALDGIDGYDESGDIQLASIQTDELTNENESEDDIEPVITGAFKDDIIRSLLSMLFMFIFAVWVISFIFGWWGIISKVFFLFFYLTEVVWYTFLGITWNSHKVGPYVLFVLIFLAYSVPVLTGYYDDYCQLLTKIIVIMKHILKEKKKQKISQDESRPTKTEDGCEREPQTNKETASLVQQRYGHAYITAANMPYNMAINRDLFEFIVDKYKPTGPNKIARLFRILTFAVLLYCGIEALLGLNEFSNVSDEIKLFVSILIAGILPTLARIVQNQGQKTREHSIRVMEMRRDIEMYFITGEQYRNVGCKWPSSTGEDGIIEDVDTKFDVEKSLGNHVYRLSVY